MISAEVSLRATPAERAILTRHSKGRALLSHSELVWVITGYHYVDPKKKNPKVCSKLTHGKFEPRGQVRQ